MNNPMLLGLLLCLNSPNIYVLRNPVNNRTECDRIAKRYSQSLNEIWKVVGIRKLTNEYDRGMSRNPDLDLRPKYQCTIKKTKTILKMHLE